jgi:putative ABC transport system permease protein
MENIVAANIRSRPTRAFISILAVALGVTLLLVVGGMVKGALNDSMQRTLSMGADFILQPPGSSALLALSGAELNEKLAGKLLEEPGIAAVTPVLSKFIVADWGLIFGIDMESFNKFSGRPQIISGRAFQKDNEAIVDELYAASKKLAPGKTMTILGHDFTVSGICRQGAVVRVFVPLNTLKKLNGTPDKVTLMFIKAMPGVNVEQKLQDLTQNDFKDYSLIRAEKADQLMASMNLPIISEFRATLILISMLLSFMVILLAMYTTIFERTREIGILKSLGASQRFIVGMILKESAIICSSGAILGIVISELIRTIVIMKHPTMQVAMGFGDLVMGLALGLVAGTLGALYPAFKAARMDPVKALSYE